MRSLQDGPSHPKVRFLKSQKWWDAESTGNLFRHDSFLPDKRQQGKIRSLELEDSLTPLTLLLSTARRQPGPWNYLRFWYWCLPLLHSLINSKQISLLKKQVIVLCRISILEERFDSQKNWKESSWKNKKLLIPTLRNHDPLEWKVLHFSACPVVENIWGEYLHKNTF